MASCFGHVELVVMRIFNMKIEIDIILKQLKEQHDLRRELQECGSSEVNESWDSLKYKIEQEIKKETPNYISDIIEQIRSS